MSSTDSQQPRSGRTVVAAVGAATLVCAIAGPFGTDALPAATRLLFWGTLIGFNAYKWRLWFRFVPPLLPPSRAALPLLFVGGALLLNAMLPLEIGWLYAAVGQPIALPWTGLFMTAVVIALAISAVIAVINWPDAAATPQSAALAPTGDASSTATGTPPPLPATGLAARVPLATLHAIVAEDHYLRLHLADGRQPLLLYRFGDALLEVAALDGTQVHRGAWVAAAAVTGCTRDGRKWRLRLADTTEVPVSDTYLPAVRARGWLLRQI
ncbi:MAG: LytTR family DNA-binding domain-containing protein [Polymorphobacter sp.]